MGERGAIGSVVIVSLPVVFAIGSIFCDTDNDFDGKGDDGDSMDGDGKDDDGTGGITLY